MTKSSKYAQEGLEPLNSVYLFLFPHMFKVIRENIVQQKHRAGKQTEVHLYYQLLRQ